MGDPARNPAKGQKVSLNFMSVLGAQETEQQLSLFLADYKNDFFESNTKLT